VSKISRRPRREERKEAYHARKKEWQELRRQQKEQGLKVPPKPTLPNRKSQLATIEEEKATRQQVVEEKLKFYRALLPRLLKRLAHIPDPRYPKTIKHKLTVVLLYGLLMFVLQMSSRREANRRMSMPVLRNNLQALFPELESLPHHDTLNRLLSRIEVEQISQAHTALIRDLMRNKKFARYLSNHRYIIALDGTGKFSRDIPWADEALERRTTSSDGNSKYYVYILEANLVFPGWFTIPLDSEFLEYSDGDVEEAKQDCELKAFIRMAARIKKQFPHLPITVLLDGLYAKGPIIAMCQRYHWQFMIVLQDGCLPSVWEEAEGLIRLGANETREQNFKDRRQHFWWVNNILYEYGPNGRHKVIVHLVVCEESWQEIARDTNEVITKNARHAWISSEPLDKRNVHKRCNLTARYRWAIENHILAEKHQGYHYEHCFSYNWNAMKGFHYLMRLAHLLNILALLVPYLAEQVANMGKQGLIQFFRETLAGTFLDLDRIRALLNRPHQLRWL